MKLNLYTEDPIVIGDILMTFLRRLPEPLVPLHLRVSILPPPSFNSFSVPFNFFLPFPPFFSFLLILISISPKAEMARSVSLPKKGMIQLLRSVCDQLPDFAHSLLECVFTFLNKYCNAGKCLFLSPSFPFFPPSFLPLKMIPTSPLTFIFFFLAKFAALICLSASFGNVVSPQNDNANQKDVIKVFLSFSFFFFFPFFFSFLFIFLSLPFFLLSLSFFDTSLPGRGSHDSKCGGAFRIFPL